MFELSIFCVIALAIGYCATLFLMGRREDVLQGDFLEGKEQSEPTRQLVVYVLYSFVRIAIARELKRWTMSGLATPA